MMERASIAVLNQQDKHMAWTEQLLVTERAKFQYILRLVLSSFLRCLSHHAALTVSSSLTVFLSMSRFPFLPLSSPRRLPSQCSLTHSPSLCCPIAPLPLPLLRGWLPQETLSHKHNSNSSNMLRPIHIPTHCMNCLSVKAIAAILRAKRVADSQPIKTRLSILKPWQQPWKVRLTNRIRSCINASFAFLYVPCLTSNHHVLFRDSFPAFFHTSDSQ